MTSESDPWRSANCPKNATGQRCDRCVLFGNENRVGELGRSTSKVQKAAPLSRVTGRFRRPSFCKLDAREFSAKKRVINGRRGLKSSLRSLSLFFARRLPRASESSLGPHVRNWFQITYRRQRARSLQDDSWHRDVIGVLRGRLNFCQLKCYPAHSLNQFWFAQSKQNITTYCDL